AAGGGPRGRRTLVGEDGPEIVDLAPGSQVHSTPDTMRMLSEGGGGPVVVNFHADGSRAGELLLELMREAVRERGGNAQAVFGWSR
ncbi:MAG: hypothetical protein S0880_10300, partial [Actinomycetota bacterium]|nr:hypothetical protein [Actinomycetota bacterium]